MAEEPRLWLIRARNGEWTDDFVENGYVGIGYNLDGVDMSNLKTLDEVREIYAKENTGNTNEQSNRNRSSQIAAFHLDVKKDDFVVTPGVGGKIVRYGRFSSDDTYYVDDADGLPCRNRRRVDWEPRKLSGDDLPPTILTIQGTVRQIRNDANKSAFFELIGEYRPEDSWVPFHLEVGRKLIEGEWWLDENRDDMIDLIQQLREADPSGTTEVNATFDPFNLYQAFCQRDYGSSRERCFEVLRDKLSLEADLPSTDSRIWSIPSSRRVKVTLRDERLDAFWDMFRAAIEMDPANDPMCREEFAERYNRVHAAGDRGQWWRILSTWLHLIDPTKFVHLHRLEKLGVLDELRLGYYAGGGGGGWADGYVRALVRARELADQAGLTLLALNNELTTREMLYPDEAASPGGSEPYTLDHMLNDGLFFEPSKLQRILDRFLDKKNLILQGPPGVGKTFVTRRLAYALMGERADRRIRNVQFHQSYSYEEFVQGYRPTTNANDELKFELQDGTFLGLCDEARDKPDDRYVMVIDEINRGNLSRVFGELLSMIENDKRGDGFMIRLAGGNEFWVPENVYILGTMNLADRSLAGMDYAMRRRFAFVTLKPQFGESVFVDWLSDRDVPPEMITRINDRMLALNNVIGTDTSLGRNFAVGHSYFCDITDGGEDDWERWYREIVETEIRPLLEEYWFDDLGKADGEVGKLLGEQ